MPDGIACLGATSFASNYGALSTASPYAAGHGSHYTTPPTPAGAVLYDNGGDDGVVGYTIDFNLSVTNSFTLGAHSTLNAVTFSNWFLPGDTGSTVDWLITTAAFGGTTVASGTASLGGNYQTTNSFGYDVYSETFTLGGLDLAAGTYWLQLQNEVVTNGHPGYWGESNGPSQGVDSDLGAEPSESFSISGSTGGSTIPEPGSLIFLGTGLLSAAAMMRRKLNF